MSAAIVVIGIGNRFRRDDGSGLRVLEALADRLPASTLVIESDGEPTRLIDAWSGADLAIIVDTVRSGGVPGTVAVIDGADQLGRPGDDGRDAGSHGLGVLEAVALGRAVDRMPGRLRVVGIEPEDVGWGEGLSDPVEASIQDVASLVLDYVRTSVGD